MYNGIKANWFRPVRFLMISFLSARFLKQFGISLLKEGLRNSNRESILRIW
ncbi:hypothetical protein HMPREF0322_05333 [Desulfitobacterium hafniense DP7]|uniref:Uncharacterized protein n=1 Tax=Desulfitobacterium hafniense DP7 TaxID=537010 RepID=G9XWG6_DESHA|nr:hypothetical protein HMPREF0322_05333 [Desulfitobacterium hafniense DP7]